VANEARQALQDYIEDALGQSIEEAYPDEWASAAGGEEQDITIDLGDDLVRITLSRCYPADGNDYEIGLDGRYHFDITSNAASHPDNAQAWTTGLNSANTGYAASIADSRLIHTAQGQTSSIASTGSSTQQGTMKAWRKNPRRIVDINPVEVTVPQSPSSANPVRATLGWVGSSPRHGEWVRFFNPGFGGGQPLVISEVGPPICFGLLMRSDAQVAAGHPLTDWWIATNGVLNDSVNASFQSMARTSGVGIYSRSVPSLSLSSSSAELDAEFDDFHNDIYSGIRATSSDSNVAGETITLTTSASYRGWACLWWWHPVGDWYWRVPSVTGNASMLNNMYHVPNAVTAGSSGMWSSLTLEDHLASIRTAVPSGPADEIVEYEHPTISSFPLTDTHRQPSMLGRGPWVRIAPGEPPDDVCITDAKCVVPSRT
jgi:hypothetical protein